MDHQAPWKEGMWLTDACRAMPVVANPTLSNVPMAVRHLQLNLFGEILQEGMHFDAFTASLHGGLVPMIEGAIVGYLSMCWATAGQLEDMVAIVLLPQPEIEGMAAAPQTKVLGLDPGVSVDDLRVVTHLRRLENVVAVVRLGADPEATVELMKEAGVPNAGGPCIRMNAHFVTTTLVGSAKVELQLRGTLHARTDVEARTPSPDEEEGLEDIFGYVAYGPLLNLEEILEDQEDEEEDEDEDSEPEGTGEAATGAPADDSPNLNPEATAGDAEPDAAATEPKAD